MNRMAWVQALPEITVLCPFAQFLSVPRGINGSWGELLDLTGRIGGVKIKSAYEPIYLFIIYLFITD